MNILLPELISSRAHYDDIPAYCLGNTILDVGSSNGYGVVMSRHVTHFLSNEYLGVDIQSFEDIYLPIIKTDIFDFKTGNLILRCINCKEPIIVKPAKKGTD